jgi:regulator of sigma E protease
MDFLLSLLSFGIVVIPLIIIHEWGHFIACRMVGVTVLEFGIGFPPRAVKLFERRGTEFTLNWLPLGGFVRPLGEDFVRPLGPEATEKDRQAYEQYKAELEAIGRKVGKLKAVYEATPLQRLWFLVAGSTMNFVAGLVLLILAATIGLPPLVTGVAPNSPAQAAGLQARDAILRVNGVSVAKEEDVTKQLEADPTKPITVLVNRDGQEMTFTIPPTDRRFPRQAILVVGIVGGSPADGVLAPEDVILRVDGVARGTATSLREYFTEKAGTPIELTVLRDGKETTLSITPRTNPPQGQGPVGINISQLTFDTTYGISFSERAVAYPLGEAIGVGIANFGGVLGQLVRFPVDLIRGALTVEEARPVSIVGISQVGGQVVNASIEDRSALRLLNFAALISLALGFTNLLPIPGLDGGRILFVLIEIVRGKPMKPEREGLIHLVGILSIMGLFVLLVINDIVNPIGQVIR